MGKGFPAALLLPLVVAAFASGCASQESGGFSMEVDKSAALSGEEINVLAFANGYSNAEKIALEYGNEKTEFACGTEKICRASVSFRPGAGVYLIKATLLGRSGIMGEKSERIVVVDNATAGCVNGAEYGKCASQRPLYCDNGKLVDNCELCGCSQGHYCSGAKCLPHAGNAEIVNVGYPERALAGKAFTVRAIIKPDANSPEGAGFEPELIIGGKSYASPAKKVAGANGELEAMFEGVYIASEGKYGIELRVYALNAQKELAGTWSKKDAVNVLASFPPPAAPSLLSAFAEGDDVVLSWETVEGAAGYKLYRSVDANPAYIAYKYDRPFNGSDASGVVNNMAAGTHFFVLTAIDEFGQESGYSEVKSATIGGGTG